MFILFFLQSLLLFVFFIFVIFLLLLLDVVLIIIFNEVFKFELTWILKTECSFEWLSQIIARMYVLQEILEIDKFFISFVKFEWNDWNAIAELIAKAPYRIINQNHVLERNVVNDS